MLGLTSIGIDSNKVASALTEAKIVSTTPNRIVRSASNILEQNETVESPDGEFWDLAFHKKVLEKLCRLRANLLNNCQSDTRKALRAIIMGALHGPQYKTTD